MKPLVVGFSGAIASGKSTVSRAVADATGLPRVGFGDYVRSEARRRGQAITRESLQSLGEELIAKGWREFCGAVLGQVTWTPGAGLVVDGIRHVEAVKTIRELVEPSRFVLVFVDTGSAVRSKRLEAAGIVDPERLRQVELHSTEMDIKSRLPAIADLVLAGDRPVQELVDTILVWVRDL